MATDARELFNATYLVQIDRDKFDLSDKGYRRVLEAAMEAASEVLEELLKDYAK